MRSVKVVRQPHGSSICGQCCVAMATGVSLEQAFQATGTRGATSTRQVHNALLKLGVESDEKATRTRKHGQLPEFAIVRARWGPPTWSHWILKWGCKWFDPERGEVDQPWVGFRLTSYIVLYIRK